jgi:hypothetical protein
MSKSEHFLLSVLGGRWKEAALAMFTVYIDDSGSDPNQKIAIASALLVPARRIAALEGEWSTFLEKYHLEEFHTSEFVAGHREDKEKVCARVRQLARKYASRAFSYSVSKNDYDAVISKELRDVGGKYHYTWAVRHVITFLQRHAEITGLAEPYEYVFDSMGPKKKKNFARREIQTLMAQAEEVKPGHFEGHYDFKNRSDLPALQLADMLAWTCFQFASHHVAGKPLHPIAKEGFWEFERFRDKKWMTAMTQTRANLEDWVTREIADPQSKARRDDWLTRNPSGLVERP